MLRVFVGLQRLSGDDNFLSLFPEGKMKSNCTEGVNTLGFLRVS